MPDQRLDAETVPHPGIRLEPGERIYAVGDVHGRRDLLERLLERIRRDLADRPAERVSLVFLGDYVDRGPHSKEVIETLSSTEFGDAEAVFLMGNHERLMLDFLDDASVEPLWALNGGEETLASYGIEVGDYGRAPDLARLARDFEAAIPAAHRTFFSGLRHSHRRGTVFFAHAGINPQRPLQNQKPEELMWIRDPFLYSTRDTGVVVVHGHTPRSAPEVTPHRIGIDTGAWMTGHLTAAALADGEVRFLGT